LGRKKEPRKALLRNLVISLILHEKIKTTLPKAKALKMRMERLVEWAKRGDLVGKRRLGKELYFGPAVLKMTKVLGPQYKNRIGGYLRVIRLGHRLGDGAVMAQVEFVESKPEAKEKEKVEEAKETAKKR